MPVTGWSERGFRVVLIAVGAFIVFLGINVGFGGIVTLGWQGPTQFLEITDEQGYLVRDSHIRFFGGAFGGIGLFLIIAATNPRRFRSPLSLVFVLLFIGGLARFSMARLDVIFGPDLLGAVLAELVLMPILLLWLHQLGPEVCVPRHRRSSAVDRRLD
jgi:hypothetical protein